MEEENYPDLFDSNFLNETYVNYDDDPRCQKYQFFDHSINMLMVTIFEVSFP